MVFGASDTQRDIPVVSLRQTPEGIHAENREAFLDALSGLFSDGHMGKWMAYADGLEIEGPLPTQGSLTNVVRDTHADLKECFMARVTPQERAAPEDNVVVSLKTGFAAPFPIN